MAIGRSGVARQIQTLLEGGSVTGLTDTQLLERFVAGRGKEAEPAFAALVARHGPMVLGVCRGLLKNQHDAEDAFQATFLVLARKAGSVRRPELLGPWLHGIAHRSARRQKDKENRRRRHEAEATMSGSRSRSESVRPEQTQSTREEVEALLEEIEGLPEKYRMAIVLCELQGLTHEEAARRLGRPVGTISARLHRARERLRGRLSRRGLALPSGALALVLGTGRASAMPASLTAATIKAAISVSAGLTAASVPASVITLSEGVLRSMILTNLKIASVVIALAGAAATGVTVLAQHYASVPIAQAPAPLPAAAELDPEPVPVAAAEIEADEEAPRETELIVRSASNLKRIAQAMHAHVETMNAFPPQAISGNGKPLLSWRVAILPYLGEEEKALHGQFKLDEPWDSAHNTALLAKMPEVYAPVIETGGEGSRTYYQAFAGKGAFFEEGQKISYAQITDGTVSTLMVVEADKPVPWTKPEDIVYVPDQPLPKLGGQFKDGFLSLTADGAPRFTPKSIDPKLLRFLITRNGGEVIDSRANMGESIRTP
jgi:RNA polymerase sigma factor (sigma-70 family)